MLEIYSMMVRVRVFMENVGKGRSHIRYLC